MVVRKGYEHPEIVMKILSVLFDYTRYEADDAEEVNSYFALNVDPTARPLVINVDYNEATYKVTEDMQKVIAGKMREEELSAIEKSYYSACMNYLKGKNVTRGGLGCLQVKDFSSRSTGGGPLSATG